MSNARAARRRAVRGETVPKEIVCPVRISEPPKTEAERYTLEKRCLAEAKNAGHRGARAKLVAAQFYNAAVAEASRAVREPSTQPSVLTRPGPTVPTPAAPRGMQQRASGLYVPEPAPDSQETR